MTGSEDAGRTRKRRIISLVFIGIMLASVVAFTSPASAVDTSLSVADDNVRQGKEIDFTTTIQIRSDERIPIDQIRLRLTGEEDHTITFKPGGEVTSGQTWVEVSPVEDNAQYGYGYRRGVDEATNYPYAFGYGYGYGGSSVQAPTYKFKLTIDTSELGPGDYTGRVLINSDGNSFFGSNTESFTVKPPRRRGGGGGGGGLPDGGDPGEVEIESVQLLKGTVKAGAPVMVQVDLVNFDPARGTIALELMADGEVKKSETVAVAASSRRTFLLKTRFESPGTYELSINGQALNMLTVEQAPTTTTPGSSAPDSEPGSPTKPTGAEGSTTPTGSEATSTPTDTASPPSPNFGLRVGIPVLAGLSLVSGGLFLLRRRGLV